MSMMRGAGRCGSRSRLVRYRNLAYVGLILFVTGYLGPWVGHKTAALTVTGLELAEFAKFFPQVQGGTVPIARQLFYFPLVASSILVVLLVGRALSRATGATFGRLARAFLCTWCTWVVPFLCAALLLMALLPYAVVQAFLSRPSVSSILESRYAGQLTLVAVGIASTLLAPLAHRCSERLRFILVGLLALAGAVPALWQLALLCPLVVALYGAPFQPGWGMIVCAVGAVLLFLSGLSALVRK
jgi:hypothetical protein